MLCVAAREPSCVISCLLQEGTNLGVMMGDTRLDFRSEIERMKCCVAFRDSSVSSLE